MNSSKAQVIALSAGRAQLQRAAHASPFAKLDGCLRAGTRGSLRVTAPPASFAPLARHIDRRCAQLGRRCVVVHAGRHEEPIRLLLRQLGIALSPSGQDTPEELAAELSRRCNGAVVVIAGAPRGQWERQVREALRDCSRRKHSLVVIELAAPESRQDKRPTTLLRPARNAADGALIDETLILTELSEQDRRLWWRAAVEQPPTSFAREADIRHLDAWWQRAQGLPLEPIRPPRLDRAASTLRGTLAHAGMRLSRTQALSLGTEGAIAALLDAGMARLDEHGLSLLPEVLQPDVLEPPTISKRQLRKLAATLAAERDNPGMMMRAAEVAADAGDDNEAERYAIAALTAASERVSRQDLWRRYIDVLARLDEEQRLARLLRAAEQALGLGDGERAEELTRSALALDSQRFDVLFAHGRACQLRGDLTAAALSLTRAIATAVDEQQRAQAAALMAHVRLVAGDDAQAESFALQSIAHATEERTRLDGRNVLGKLLLARDAWVEAEEHFAQDAYDAAICGEHEAELRARLNRALAVLSLGRREQARELLDKVLQAGEQRGLPRAIAFALSNLATVAILQHRFADALALSERAIGVRTRLGIRHGLVQPITNLAELRIMLGMVDEAEESLRFGLKACGSNLPASLYAYFAKTMARVHLARGDSAKAHRSLTTALSSAAITGDVSLPGQCHRIAARIALEDGDVARARTSLKRAQSSRQSGFGVADLVVIEAEIGRAGGEPYTAVAERAFGLGEQTGNIEAMLQACVLLAQAALAGDDEEAARGHLEHALHIRQGVAEALPEALRERYLNRVEMRTLNQLLTRPTAAQRSQEHSAPPARRKRRGRSAETPKLIGRSHAMVALRRSLKRIAETDTTVLIHGETGSGKELVAEAIHAASERASGPLVKVNCAALVETLLLSELFGHERGAFTGASARRRGRFELADGGTLFLDEIGDISPRTQVALLRVLQDGTFERVGGCTQLRSDVRVIVATHRDLKALVAQGKFRQDLYYRLCGMVVEVPALRERAEDIGDLAEALLARAQRQRGVTAKPLSHEALALLRAHSWPGNVRELQNALRAAAVFSTGEELSVADFVNNVEGLRAVQAPARPVERRDELPASSSSELVYAEVRAGVRLADMKRRLERQCIAQALVETGGNITRAAELLGMKRPRLSQLVKKYELATVVEEAKS